MFFKNKKSVSTIIAAVVVILIAVILSTIVLNFGKNLTQKETQKVTEFYKEDATLTGSTYVTDKHSTWFKLKNTSSKSFTFTKYKIVSNNGPEFLNSTYIDYNTPITIDPGYDAIIPFVCSPERSFKLSLLNSDNKVTTISLDNIVDYQQNLCDDLPNPVCLGLVDNGSGDSVDDPIIVCNAGDLNNVRNGLDKHYLQGDNINLDVELYNEGEGWEPIGTSVNRFTGSIDGNGYVINNLYINKPAIDYIGLFGYTDIDSVINNIKLESVDIIGNQQYTGGLAGVSKGTISSSYSTGSVSGAGTGIYDGYIGGLVGYQSSGTISSSYFTGSVSGTSYWIGGLVGYQQSSGTISSSYSAGSVSSTSYEVGGLVGISRGTISSSYSTSSVFGTSDQVGGLVGKQDGGTISSSYSTGSVSSTSSNVGGLVGYQYNGTISSSYATGSVSSTSSYVGGLVGVNKGIISSSYSTGSVSGTSNIGGFVGYQYGGTISNSYSLGDIFGTSVSGIGGFLGVYYSSGAINNSYSAGKVFSNLENLTNLGFSGTSNGVYSNDFWNTETSIQSTSYGTATGKTSAEMMQQSTFTSWDFDDIWEIEDGTSYPYLQENEPLEHPKPTHSVISSVSEGTYYELSLDVNLMSGADNIYYTLDGTNPNCSGIGTEYNGTITLESGTNILKTTGCSVGCNNDIYSYTYILPEPITILTSEDLYNVRNDLNGFYFLGANIDLDIRPYNEEEGWEPIGNSINQFNGVFDGNGYNISNLYINSSNNDYLGLFSYSSENAILRNINLEDIYIFGNKNDYIGGLVALNSGDINNCSTTGYIYADSVIGGLVGHNYYGDINNSYSEVDSFGGSYIGGLVAKNEYSNIELSYSIGSVSGVSSLGGLVGRNYYSEINKCFATGNIYSRYFSGYLATGAFIGWNGDGSVFDCYSLGSIISLSAVDNYDRTGAFIGWDADGDIRRCYSSGTIYTLENRITDRGFFGNYSTSGGPDNTYSIFWDTTTSLQSNDVFATGKTSTQMKQQSTFTNWDFDDIWTIEEGTSYPYLINNQLSNSPKPAYGVFANETPGIKSTLSLDVSFNTDADTIYYTLDGTDPSCSGTGTEYTSSIPLTINTYNIKAVACKSGFDERISSFNYVLPTPSFIFNVDDLNNIRNNIYGLYIFASDIDLDVSPYNDGNGWDPIDQFSGKLEGNNKTISNLFINKPTNYYAGLFERLYNSDINNLNLDLVDITGYYYTGGLAALSYYDTTISNCSINGTLSSSSSYTGGIVGSTTDTNIVSCVFDGTISGSNYVGGLIGKNEGDIYFSNSSGSISGASNTGGLVGELKSGFLNKNYSSADVTGENYVGGLFGGGYSNSNVVIYGNYATGNVIGENRVGGLVGSTSYSSNYIVYSYATGNVTGEDYVGGLIGYGRGNLLVNNFSSGQVSGNSYIGGLLGINAGYKNLYNNFYDSDISGQSDTDKGIPKTTVEMKQQSTFEDVDWDFINIWDINESISYPYFRETISPYEEPLGITVNGNEEFVSNIPYNINLSGSLFGADNTSSVSITIDGDTLSGTISEDYSSWGVTYGVSDGTYDINTCITKGTKTICDSTTDELTIYYYPCFEENTNILLTDGSTKKIKDIKKGDKVISYDFFEDKQIIGEVLLLQEHNYEDFGYYTVNNKLKITDNHPLLINDIWNISKNLKLGDYVRDKYGYKIYVNSIDYNYTNKVYNIILNNNVSSFYADDYLVSTAMFNGGFSSENNVLLEDYSTKQIKDIQKGDKVISYNENTKTYEPNNVIDVRFVELENYYLINNTKVRADESFYVKNNGWKFAKDLKINDIVIGENVESKIENIQKIKNTDLFYILSVENNNNFIINNMLVHNSPAKPPPPPPPPIW